MTTKITEKTFAELDKLTEEMDNAFRQYALSLTQSDLKRMTRKELERLYWSTINLEGCKEKVAEIREAYGIKIDSDFPNNFARLKSLKDFYGMDVGNALISNKTHTYRMYKAIKRLLIMREFSQQYEGHKKKLENLTGTRIQIDDDHLLISID